MEFGELSREEFRELSKRSKCGSFLQSEEMRRRYEKKGLEYYLLGVRRNGEVLAGMLVVTTRSVKGKKIFKAAGGPLLDYEAERAPEILKLLTREAKAFLRGKGGLVLQVNPNIVSEPRDRKNNIVPGVDHLAVKKYLQGLGWKYLGEYEQVKWEYVMETAGEDLEELFMGLRSDHRQRIRRARRDGVKIRELGLDELPVLKKIAAEAGDRHGFHDPSVDYYKEMAEAFGEKVKFMVAEAPVEGEMTPVTAAMFVMDKPREIVYLFSGSVREHQKLGGAHLLQWEMISRAVNEGYARYNFYGVRPVEGDGVYKFKQGFKAGRVEELLGTFMLPLCLLGWIYTLRIRPQEMGAVE